MDRVGMTSYSDYMRCLAAKYNNNQTSGPALSSPPQKADLLPLLAAHGSHFPAAFSIPGLSLFNPFLTSQASDSKPAPTVNITSNASERLKRPKEDPLDLTDKKLKREDSVESEKSLSPKTPRTPSPRVRPNTPKTRAMADWTVEEVAEFVSKVDDCQHYAKVTMLTYLALHLKLLFSSDFL